MPTRAKRSMAAGALSLIAVLAATLAYNECVLRTIEPGAIFRTWFSAGSQMPDSRFGFVMTPNFRGYQEYQEIRAPIALDRFGFRNTESPLDSPKKKILFLGGASITFGWGVRESETFPSVAASALEEGDWQAVNASTPGYLLLRQLAHFNAIADSIRPDILVLVIQRVVDAGNYARSDAYGSAMPIAPKAPRRIEFVHGQPMPTTIESPLLRKIYASSLIGARAIYPSAEKRFDDRLHEEGMRGMMKFGFQESVDFLLDLVTEYCSRRGIDLYVVAPRSRIPPEFNAAFDNYCQRRGYWIPFLDLRDFKFETRDPYVYDHFSAAGNREIGLTIAKFINRHRRRGTTWRTSAEGGLPVDTRAPGE